MTTHSRLLIPDAHLTAHHVLVVLQRGDRQRPVAFGHMSRRARAECASGGVHGRDSRTPASLHHRHVTQIWRPATPLLRPIAMTRRTHRMHPRVREFMDFFSQETARTNAAEASAELRERRHEREEVDAYLRALHSPMVAAAR